MFQSLLAPLAFASSFSQSTLQTIQNSIHWLHIGHGPFVRAQKAGLGFELSLGYATAAIAFPNGTTLPVARLEVGSDYVQAMTNFANESLVLGPPDAPRDYYGCSPLPSPLNEDGVNAISAILNQLKLDAEQMAGQHFASANVAIPWLYHLCRADLDKAMQQAGLEYLHQGKGTPGRTSLYTTSAVMVANGHGVCSDYTEMDACDAEEAALSVRAITHVEITENWLRLTCPLVSSSYNLTNTLYNYDPVNLALKLGLKHRKDMPDPDTDPENPIDGRPYWDRVYYLLLVNIIQACRGIPEFQVLSGEGADDKDFREVFRMSQNDYERRAGIRPLAYRNHTLFAAAEGAAELAKRALWKMDHDKHM